jgi:hypothetical protein
MSTSTIIDPPIINRLLTPKVTESRDRMAHPSPKCPQRMRPADPSNHYTNGCSRFLPLICLFAAKSPSEEIREQMKDLQHELDRTKPKKKKSEIGTQKGAPREVIACYAAAENRSGHFATACVHAAISGHGYSPVPQHNGCGGPQL